MSHSLINYDEALDYEDLSPPPAVREILPDELDDAEIKGGETYGPDTSVRLNGPPGAGKTTQACLRIAYLILLEGVDPRDITVVTYRRDLAGKIERDLKEWGVIDDDEDLQMWSTAHAVANRVHGLLSGDADDDGLGPAVEAREKAYFCDEVLDVNYWASKPWENTRGKLFFNVVEHAHNNLLDPSDESDLRRVPEYDDLMDEWSGVDVATIYEQWQAFKKRSGWVEFHELLQSALTGALPPTRVLVIDEYHDAYPLMARVCERWINNAESAIVLGDPLQVVNSYTGADPRFFAERLDDIPEVLLDKSWRCPEEIWQAAVRMLEQEYPAPPINRDGLGGRICEYKSPPMHYIDGVGWDVPDKSIPGSPGSVVEQYISGESDRDALLIARMRKQAKGISAALDEDGIIHDAQDGLGGWDVHRVDLFNGLLKLRDCPTNYGRQSHGSGLNEYFEAGEAAGVSVSPAEAVAIIEHSHARTLEVSASDVESLVARISEQEEDLSPADIDQHVKPEFWETYASPRGSRELTKTGVSRHHKLNERDLTALQNALSRYEEPVSGDDVKRIRVLTIHASKGAEATDVVVYDGISSRIASDLRTSEAARKNEARTWYVALSRAVERLHVMRDAFSWTQPHLPSNIRESAVRRAKRVCGDAADAGGPADA